jgi:hypothetical protein
MRDRRNNSRDAVNEIFGEALPSEAPDDRESSSSDSSEHDRWLRENTPPHHQ